jgi:hypothetical protein
MLNAQHTTIKMVVPLLLSGFSTLSTRRPMVTLLMALLTAGSRWIWSNRLTESESVIILKSVS